MEKGQVIDSKYTIDSVLGGGSFSEVFVVDGPTGRSALKLLRKALSGMQGDPSGETVEDFKHEFAILKDLNHPNICRILDFGFDPKIRQYYYTTELVEGRDLFEATEGKTVEEILELFVQALRAFHYLHSYKVHHFDVKAANVLVATGTAPAPSPGNPIKSLFSKRNPSPTPNRVATIKVIDFGLACIDPRGKMIGTPAYMAPEIIAKEKPDARSDLYSLGVLFYACFTRQNPFRGKSVPETLKNQQTVIAPPASSLREEIPNYLDRILVKLLEKNPANRYQRAEEVLREINFYSPKKFAMETRETLLSYLPEEGRLIARKREGETFAKAYERVFAPASPDTMGFILILGDTGTGKSRLLKDFKYEAQLKGVSVESASVKDPEEIKTWLDAFRRQATEGRPTVYLLDDLDHWRENDEGFQQFRGALARLVFGDASGDWSDRLPFLWVGTAGSRDAVPVSLWDILSPEKLETLDLGPFTPQELKEYVSSLTGLEDLPQRLLNGLESRTNGNPLLVTEILRSLIDQGALFDAAGRWKKTTFEDLGLDFSKARFSGVLEELLYGRYEKLPGGLKRALEAMAVAGRLRPGELSKMTEIEDPAPLLEILLSRDLVARDEPGGRYHLKNDMLSDLILAKLPEERRRALHDLAAELHPEGSQARLFHEIRGSDLDRAFALSRRAAEGCLHEARGHEAAELYRLALALPAVRSAAQEIELLLKLGEACMLGLDYPTALETFGKVEKILSGVQNPLENVNDRVDALLKIGGVYLKMGEIEKARGSLESALTLLRYLKGDRVRELIAENYRGAILVQEGKLEEARQIFERTRQRWDKELSPQERTRVTNNDLGVVYLATQQYAQALRQFQADLEASRALGDRLLMTRTHYHLGEACLGLKDFAAAVEHYQLSANLAQALKNTEFLLRAYNGLGNSFNLMGKPEEAVRYYERGLDLCERTGDLRSHAGILVNIGIIEAAQNRFDKSLRYLEPAVSFLKSLRSRLAIDRQVLVRALLEEGDVFLKQKDWKASEDALREALRISEEGEGASPLRFWVLYTLAELLREKGDASGFHKLLPEIRKSAQSPEEIEKASTLAPSPQSPADAPPEHPPKQPTEATQLRVPAPQPRIARTQDPYAYILEINKFLNAESDLSFVLKSVLNYALELSQAEAGAILLRDEQEGLTIAASRNLDKKDPISEISRTVAGRAIASGKPLVLQDVSLDPSLASESSVMRLDLKSVICLPVSSKRRILGALYLDNRLLAGAFEHVDLDVLQAFSDQAGIAIENARLLSALEGSKKSLEEKVTEMSARIEQFQSLVHVSGRGFETKYAYEGIVARSKPMQETFRLLDKITDTDLTVFVHGESGTGKELVARALHDNSSRSKNRFVAVNCGAIPAHLLESELFGYKAGAFTGATRDKKGLFEDADGGTLFLDEVAELELSLQAKLLRAVQEGEFYRLGDNKTLKADVRVVSASNKDIEKLAKEGKFREDLYYRLCQIRLDLPALRERREDIPLLIDAFVRQEAGKPLKISTRLLKAMLEYDWPGNIRELENIVKVAVALADEGVIDAKSIPSNYGLARFLLAMKLPRAEHVSDQRQRRVEGEAPAAWPTEGATQAPMINAKNRYDPSKSWYDYEKLILAKAYRLSGFNAKETAEMLGLAPATVYKKVREVGLADKNNVLYAEDFHYEKGKKLEDYLKPVFQAALSHAGDKPYAAIANLRVSQGYFYKVMKAV